MVDPAERRLEPLCRGFAFLVLALCELEALPGSWELLVPGWLGQLARPLVQGPGRGQLADGVFLGAVHVHGFHPRGWSGTRRPVAGLGRAAVSPGGLLGGRLFRLCVLGAVCFAPEASSAAGEVIDAVSAVGAVPVFARLCTLALPFSLATPPGSVGPELAVKIVEQTLNVPQGRLGSHSPLGTKSCAPE